MDKIKIYDSVWDITSTYDVGNVKGIATEIAITMTDSYDEYLEVKPQLMAWIEELIEKRDLRCA